MLVLSHFKAHHGSKDGICSYELIKRHNNCARLNEKLEVFGETDQDKEI
jgi:hypothetical protein